MSELQRITMEKGQLLLDSFDFAKMAAFMKLTNWSWCNDGPPNADQLRSTASNLVTAMTYNERENSMCSMGGLVLTRFVWHNNVVELSLYGYVDSAHEQMQMVLRRKS